MNATQIIEILRAAGWPEGDLIPKMVAIALAESSGNPNAHNPKPPDDSYGLWQINMLGNLKAERLRQFGISSVSDLYNPVTNAAAALFLYRHGGLNHWSTYKYGQYKAYMNQAQTAYSGQAPASGGVPVRATPPGNANNGAPVETVAAYSGAGFLALAVLIVALVTGRG